VESRAATGLRSAPLVEATTARNDSGRRSDVRHQTAQVLRAQYAELERLKKTGRVVRAVFHRDGTPIRTFRRAWRTGCRAAGVPGRIPHDFRRTAVRNLERAGVPRSAAMAMVGHKTESIYRRYAIVDAGVLREAAAKIDLAAGTVPTVTGTNPGTTSPIRAQFEPQESVKSSKYSGIRGDRGGDRTRGPRIKSALLYH
jgi:integrase